VDPMVLLFWRAPFPHIRIMLSRTVIHYKNSMKIPTYIIPSALDPCSISKHTSSIVVGRFNIMTMCG
jgi:hypothetical protein